MNIEVLLKNMAMRPAMYIYPINVYSIHNLLMGYIGHFKGDINTYKFDYASVNCVFSSFIDRWIYQWIIQNIDANYDRRGRCPRGSFYIRSGTNLLLRSSNAERTVNLI